MEELKKEYLGVSDPDSVTIEILHELYKDACKNNFNSKDIHELEALYNQYNANLVQNTSSKEIFAIIQGDKNLKKINNAIYDARKQIDISTGKILKRDKNNIADAEEKVKIEEINERLLKDINNDKITNYDTSDKLNKIIDDGNAFPQKIKNDARQDSIMNEFNKVVAE